MAFLLTNSQSHVIPHTHPTSDINGLTELIQANAVVVSATAPENPTSGKLWYNTTKGVFNIYNGSSWILVGPEVTPITKAQYEALSDTDKNDGRFYLITDNDGTIIVDWANVENKPTIPTSLGELSGTSDDITEGSSHLFMTPAERTNLGNQSGVNTGDQSASDFDIKDLADTTNLRSTWSGKQDAISDLATIRSGASAGATAVQPNDNVSTLTNDAGYITNAVNDLTNYYTKTQTYTKAEVDQMISDFGGFEVVETLPTENIKTNIIYLKGPIGTGGDKYEEWIYSNSQWILIGETSVDLSNYFNTFTDTSDRITEGSTNLFVTSSEKSTWNDKQDALVSGTNIKTVNGNSLLGSGDVVIPLGKNDIVRSTLPPQDTTVLWYDTANFVLNYYNDDAWKPLGVVNGGSVEPSYNITGNLWYDINNNVLKVYRVGTGWKDLAYGTSASTAPSTASAGHIWYDTADNVLKVYDGANWIVTGKTYTAGNGISISNDEISIDTTVVATKTDLNSKQDTLVSGTNIKTVNNNSLLGSGNIDIPSGKNDIVTSTTAPSDHTVLWIKDNSGTSGNNELYYYDNKEGEWVKFNGVYEGDTAPNYFNLWYDTNDDTLKASDARTSNQFSPICLISYGSSYAPGATLWYYRDDDTGDSRLKYYDEDTSEWQDIRGPYINSSAPYDTDFGEMGGLWVDTSGTYPVVKYYDAENSQWKPVGGVEYIAGDGIDITNGSISVDVTDIIGTGLSEDNSNNIIVDTTVIQEKLTAGTGINIDANNEISNTLPGPTIAASAPTGTEGALWYDTTNDILMAHDGTDWKKAGTQMKILSYGYSTWQDFIDAYNENAIVYCRASSNRNPATGTQGRMAFMAYVNSADNPTEVEFQYYRSRSDHNSADNQIDEVYVYKLVPANGGTWTVTQRNTAAKLVAGSNVSITWGSGNAVINATDTTYTAGTNISIDANNVISSTVNGFNPSNAGTEGQVLTKTSTGYNWAAAQGGVSVGTTAPSSPTAGALWYDTTSTVLALKVYNGTAWEMVGPEVVPITQAAYDALSTEEKNNGKFYLITNASGTISVDWANVNNKVALTSADIKTGTSTTAGIVSPSVLAGAVPVLSTQTGTLSSAKIWVGSQTDYEALSTKDPNTLYFTTNVVSGS